MRKIILIMKMGDHAARTMYAAHTCLPANELKKQGISVKIAQGGELAAVFCPNYTLLFWVDEKPEWCTELMNLPVFNRELKDHGNDIHAMYREATEKYNEVEKAEVDGRDVPSIEREWPGVLKTLWSCACTLLCLDKSTERYLPPEFKGEAKLTGYTLFHELHDKEPFPEPVASHLVKWMAQ